jgi:iron complex outermembrane recepter protein
MVGIKLSGLLASSVALSTLVPAAAMAQQTTPTDASGPASSGAQGLEEIIVTSQRRSETAQSVPISVAAFTPEALAASRTLSSDDLPALVSGLTLAPNGGRTPMYLRGVGNNNAAASPAVLTFVDGVYMPFNYGAQAFNDVSSMEVAKGPQGTLFGRNATGGVILVTTKDPTDTPSGDVEVGYGNFSTISTRGYFASGLTSNLRAGVSGFYEDQMDGWGENQFNGADSYTSKRYGARAKFVYDVSDVTTIRLAADYAYGDGNHGGSLTPAAGIDFVFDAVAGGPNFVGEYNINTDRKAYFTTKEGGLSLTVDSEIGDAKFLSITSWRDNETFLQIDYDGGPTYFLNINRTDKAAAFTQEFQLSSQSEGSFKWVGGLFYFHQDPKMEPFVFFGPGTQFVFGTPTGEPIALRTEDKVDAYAGYGQASLEFVPDTTLTLGARYTVEKREQEGFNTVGGVVVPSSVGSQSETFKKPTYRVAIDHKFSDDLMVFASFNRGFNSGWFNQVSFGGYSEAANPVVEPETIDAFEVGVKSEWLDRRLRVNLSAFQYDYSNLQQQVFVLGGIVTVNAAEARIQGLDLDIQARPVENLDLALSASWLDPKFTSYPDAPIYELAPNGALITPAAGDASGFSTPQAPKFSLNASATHTLDTAVGTFYSTASVNYRDTMYADFFEDVSVKERTLVNLTERWEAADGQLSASLWIKNLLDERYDNSISLLSPVGLVGQVGAPRTYGVTVGYKFGN